jgi:hypothetical protein
MHIPPPPPHTHALHFDEQLWRPCCFDFYNTPSRETPIVHQQSKAKRLLSVCLSVCLFVYKPGTSRDQCISGNPTHSRRKANGPWSPFHPSLFSLFFWQRRTENKPKRIGPELLEQLYLIVFNWQLIHFSIDCIGVYLLYLSDRFYIAPISDVFGRSYVPHCSFLFSHSHSLFLSLSLAHDNCPLLLYLLLLFGSRQQQML